MSISFRVICDENMIKSKGTGVEKIYRLESGPSSPGTSEKYDNLINDPLITP